MNQALRGADVDVLIALNPDTEPPAGSLSTLARRLLASPDIGLVAPRLIGSDGWLQHSVYRFPTPRLIAAAAFVPTWWQRRSVGRRNWLEGFAAHDRSEDIEWAIGAVHVLRPSPAIADIPYDERWFMYVEDLDLCWRLGQAGWRRRLEADVAVPHVGNAAGGLAWQGGRTARWLWATYDWYGLRHGRWALRLFAATNVMAVCVTWLRLGFWAAVGQGLDRALARTLLDGLPIHVHVLLTGRVDPARFSGEPLIVTRTRA
jgi:GT2 family glycosyltransferase